MSQALEFSSNIDEQLSCWLGAIPVLIPILQRLNVVSISIATALVKLMLMKAQ